MCEAKEILDRLYWVFREGIVDDGPESRVYAQCSLAVNKEEKSHFEKCVECQEVECKVHENSPFGGDHGRNIV